MTSITRPTAVAALAFGMAVSQDAVLVGRVTDSGANGGGSGGATYNDGSYMVLSLCGCLLEYNQVNAYGAAIFFVTNDHSGILRIDQSMSRNNIGGSWHILPGISMHDDTQREITNSTIE